MSDIIKLLPDSVANQIAAGEVVQRPASVIKELVENSIDAGAHHVEIIVADAGKTCIRVIDDGCGMSVTDARQAFERHATSKICQASDLFALTTMGFRGEALASIAAVAQVELRTRRQEDELGTSILISGSKVEGQEPISCPKGSDFSVKNLFFNVPARRKFLKSNQTELNNILTEIDRIVLVHPDVSFTVHHNDNELYRLPIASLRMRLMNVFGKKLNDQLLSGEVETSLVKISGYVGKPESSRKKGAHQYFFVNGRYMRHPYFHRAVMEAYEPLIPAGEQISYFIYMEVNPSDIDVNIHPTKTEIKFENEQAIWQILSAAVRETLGRFGGVPSIDFDTEGRPDIPVSDSGLPTELPQVQFNPSFNPFDTPSSAMSSGVSSGGGYRRAPIDWEMAYSGLHQTAASSEDKLFELLPEHETDIFQSAITSVEERTSELPQLFPSSVSSDSVDTPAMAGHYQFKGKYIVTSVKSGLMFIDQHRAHVRVLFERFVRQMESYGGVSQGMLFPELLQLTVAEETMLQSILPDLQAVGFDLSSLGGGSYSISAIPSGTEGLDAVALVHRMVASAIEREGCGEVGAEVRTALALSLARSAAIVQGQILTVAEMDELVASLFACSTPSHTPDGLTILSVISLDEIEKRF